MPVVPTAVSAAAVFFHRCASLPRCLPLSRRSTHQLMVFRSPLRRGEPPHAGIRMDVRATIYPCAPPRCVIDEYPVCAPVEPSISPAPGTEEPADGHAESEPDSAADEKAGPRCEEYDCRIVVRHHDIAGIN